MSEAFEQLVIDELGALKQGQIDLLTAFGEHKDAVNAEFTALEVKQAADAATARTKAKLWGIGGGAISVMLTGGYETLKHIWGK